jgi:hypothetical protein
LLILLVYCPRFTDIIFVDASSRGNIEAALASFAVTRKIGTTHTNTLNWLAACEGRWLVIFDNTDDPSVRLHEFFPQRSEIDVLVTTRHRDLVLLAQGSNSDFNISGMDSDEALQLLRITSRSNSAVMPEEEKDVAALLVQVIQSH